MWRRCAQALAPVKDRMCEDNQRRAETNPLRVLDSKAPEDQEMIDALPKIADYLDADSTEHFRQVLAALDACGVPYHGESAAGAGAGLLHADDV